MKSSFAMVPAPWQQWMGGLCCWGKCAPVRLPLAFDVFLLFFFSHKPIRPIRDTGWFFMDWTLRCHNWTLSTACCVWKATILIEGKYFIVGVKLLHIRWQILSWLDIVTSVTYLKNCPKSSQSFSQPGHLHTPWPYSGWVPPLSSCRELKQRKSTFRRPTAGC